MSRRSRKRKRVCVVLFFLSCCKAFLCLVDIDVLSSFSRVMFPNRSTWRTIVRSLCFASGPHNQKTLLYERYRVSVESRPPRWRLSLSPLFNIFLITVKIDFQSCLPSQQLVLSWGVLSLLCSHVCHRRRDRFKNMFFCFFFVSFSSRFQLFGTQSRQMESSRWSYLKRKRFHFALKIKTKTNWGQLFLNELK